MQISSDEEDSESEVKIIQITDSRRTDRVILRTFDNTFLPFTVLSMRKHFEPYFQVSGKSQ